MLTHAAARDALVENLRRDATMHEAERHDEIGRRFDSLEHAFPRTDSPQTAALRVAMTFWDGWIDARNHGWQLGGTIPTADWPTLARTVADDLAAERPITDERVRARFDVAAGRRLGERALYLDARLREP
jgi:hypothetical protein